MPSLDSERPFDCWNNDLNVFAVGGVADGDWPSGGLEGILQAPECLRFLIERRRLESVDGRTVAQPSAPTVYVKQDVVGAWIIIDIQLWFPPADW